MPWKVVPSTDKIYQEDVPKAVFLKNSTRGAISRSFGKEPCT